MDAIGDFILWLQTAKYYRQIYPDQKITLICNKAYFSLAQNLTLFDEVIGVNLQKFVGDMSYFYQQIKYISINKYDVVICDMFSRVLDSADFMVLATRAKQKIGFAGDFANISPKQRKLSDKWYSRLISINSNISFEIKKNFELIKVLMPNIQFEFINIVQLFKVKEEVKPFTSKPFIVINFGAGVSTRAWPINNFIQVVNSVIPLEYAIIFVGLDTERQLFEKCQAKIVRPVINLINKTSLLETIYLITKASLVIANESSNVHIAAGVNTPSICFLGGGHFGRFMPYQIQQAGWNWPQVCYTPMACFNCNWHCIYPLENNQTWRCIANIGVEQVTILIKEILCK